VLAPNADRIVGIKQHLALPRSLGVWDLMGNELATIRFPNSDPRAIAVLPNGEYVIVGFSDGTARTLRLFPSKQALVNEVKAAIPRCLTAEERERYYLLQTPPGWCIEMHKWPYNVESVTIQSN
jgi:hypothetical protein